MILFRFLLIAFNVAVIAFLIFRMLETIKQPMDRSRKILIIAGGTLLLLAPIGIILRFFGATPQYFLIYPAAILMFLYLTRQLTIK